MNLAKNIFGKGLYELTKQDLEEFFSVPREETSTLEFKSGEIKINSIFKEICAFLNTEGGVIIIGAPKERKVQKQGVRMRRICQGQLVPSRFRDKTWLTGLITANIVPPPKELQVHEIREDEGNYFIIEAPQSKNPPHQFLTDGRYYIRLEQEAKPAPHGIVEALFYKKQRAMLRASLQVSPSGNGAETFNQIHVHIVNASQFPTDQVSYLIQLYNIREIQQDSFPLQFRIFNKEDCIEIKGESADVLVDDRTLPIHFRVENNQQPFFISVLTWNKEAGMFKIYGLYDPVNQYFIDYYKSGDPEEKTIQHFIHVLNDFTGNLE
jgi:hypothetical protein